MSTPHLHWPTWLALEVLHGPGRCRLCGGSGWVEYADPLYPDRTYPGRCPDCAKKAQP